VEVRVLFWAPFHNSQTFKTASKGRFFRFVEKKKPKLQSLIPF
jgi:hypothetical protein